jgi:hypothetical protein
MRLIKTQTLELVDAETVHWPPYAILSHRWGAQEVTLQQLRWRAANGQPHPDVYRMEGYQKIQRFCSQAAHEGIDYGWVDTCCIDKTSSAELSEAINSMFAWYSKAQVCYTYLNDVDLPHGKASTLDDAFFEALSQSQWWQRGWTLQELIAPSEVRFFSRDWTYFGDKVTLGQAITIITGIDQATLEGQDIRRVSIARRMFWASQRTTTKPEDLAYCLLGIFAVNMPLLYGEGEQAFVRLQEEIMKISDDQTIFAWEDRCLDDDSALFESHGTVQRGPLARSPAEFSNARDIVPYRQQQSSHPYTMTNYGLRMTVPLHRLRNSSGQTPVYLAELTCHYEGDFSGSLGIYIRPLKSDQYARDHGRRVPVVVDSVSHYPPVSATIFLRKDTLLPSSEDFDRHHGILARLHSPEHGFEVAYAFPQDQWMKIKGRAAIILNPGQYSAIAFKRSDGTQFTIIMSHGASNKLYESYGYDTWEVGSSRCKIFTYDCDLGAFTDEGLKSMEQKLKYEGARAERLEPVIEGCTSKTFAELPIPSRQLVVAEMKKETIMGERMLVVDINIYEENSGLHLLHGVSSAPRIDPARLQQAIPQSTQGEMLPQQFPSESLPQGQAQHFAPSLMTPAHTAPLHGFQVAMPAGMGFLLVPQATQFSVQQSSQASTQDQAAVSFAS